MSGQLLSGTYLGEGLRGHPLCSLFSKPCYVFVSGLLHQTVGSTSTENSPVLLIAVITAHPSLPRAMFPTDICPRVNAEWGMWVTAVGE